MDKQDEGRGRADLGMGGLPPVTQHQPSGYVTPEMPGYSQPGTNPSGVGTAPQGTLAPNLGTSQEMMRQMGTPPAPSPTQ